ncbi:TPA: TetR family transcriptional regulator [Burkholderia cenocepacia]|uniref:TetR/AcrR family transcriptional regulator n=1 Tax=unclassified Burkholderia TaxID=2613784 RepID=UPI0015884BE9|nr:MULTISPECIES: TetR/AcrR family transcriptional regulator [unclassified Burkholderia]HEF5873866.1 TetR family transcriptional regulator [Burkholderia cenocepacia]
MATHIKKPAPRDGAAFRQSIRRTALDVFSTYGFDATSMRQLAAAAGMDVGHLSYYYPAKEALWRDVLTECSRDYEQHVESALAAAVDSKTATERAAIVLPSLLGFMADNPKLSRLMMQEFSINSARHDWVVDTMAKRVFLRLQPLFDGLRSEGVLVDIDPTAAYFALIAGAVAFFASTDEFGRISGYGVPDAEQKKEVIAFLCRGFLATTGTPSGKRESVEKASRGQKKQST